MAFIPNTVSSPVLGIVRYVYLVQDASDQTKLGGTNNNVYTTWQSVYDAANALQILLGGSNKVVIIVGNITAASAGNLTISANWNTNVSVIGQSSLTSIVGTITTTTFSLTAIFYNITIGNISSTSGAISLTTRNAIIGTVTTTGGGVTIISATSTFGNITTSSSTGASGALALTATDSTIGNLVTTSTGGKSGNISISNSYNSSIGAVTMNASVGNVGTLTYSTCNNINTGAITLNQTSGTTSFSIGVFTMTICSNCTFSSYTSSMALVSGTGNIGGWNINNTNQGIFFTGNIVISAYTNGTSIKSDVPILNFILNNITFNGSVGINNLITGTKPPTGGVINNLNIKDCVFNGTINRFSWNAATNGLTTGIISIVDCEFTNSTSASGGYFSIVNSTFSTITIERCLSMDASFGISIESLSSTATLLNGTNPLIIQNITGQGALNLDIYQSGGLLAFDDVQVTNVNVQSIVFGISGDCCINAVNCNASLFTLSDSTGIATKTSILSNCSVKSFDSTMLPPINIGNSNVVFASSFATPSALTKVYGSTINVYAAGAIIITGVMFTSTITRKNTSTIVGLTLNNSYDESLA